MTPGVRAEASASTGGGVVVCLNGREEYRL